MTWEEFCAVNIPAPATVTVRAYLGSGGKGPVYGAPVQVGPCVVEETRRTIRVQLQDTAGRELVVINTTVWMPLATVCPPGSLVTWQGRESRAVQSARVEAHGLPLPEHLEVGLE